MNCIEKQDKLVTAPKKLEKITGHGTKKKKKINKLLKSENIFSLVTPNEIL